MAAVQLNGRIPGGASFVSWLPKPDFIVQLSVETSAETMEVVCRNLLSGEHLASWTVHDRSQQVKRSIEQVLAPAGRRRIGVVLPDGSLASLQRTWQEL